MEQRYKYPRTYHLPWSEGLTTDDKVMPSLDIFDGQEIIVTEKFDGENTTMTATQIHARSLDSKDHWSRHWVKGLWASIRHSIPDGMRLCGENVYAKHSIAYDNLASYFLLFSVWEGSRCLSWDDTIEIAKMLSLSVATELYRGLYDRSLIESLHTTMDLTKQEGYVIRLADSFEHTFDTGSAMNCVAKWVRPNHVQTDSHWMSKNTEKNHLVL